MTHAPLSPIPHPWQTSLADYSTPPAEPRVSFSLSLHSIPSSHYPLYHVGTLQILFTILPE